MKLRAKTLIIVGVTLVVLLGGLDASARWIVLDGFSEIGQRETREHVASVQNAIAGETPPAWTAPQATGPFGMTPTLSSRTRTRTTSTPIWMTTR